MDRRIFYRDQLVFESDLMLLARYPYEALGFFALDVLGSATVAAGFPCAQTTVASLSFLLGPGRIYSLQTPDATAMGQTLGVGGLGADTNVDHSFLKQAQYRDTHTLGPLTAPVTVGQSQVFLVEGQFTEADDAAVLTQFYNTSAPDTPISSSVIPARRDIAAIQIKAGTAAATGSQAQPTADSGWIPLYAITLAHGQTTITAADIAVATGAPFVSVGNPLPVREKVFAANPVSGAVTLDFNRGNYFTVLMNAAITSIVFQNLPPAGLAQEITVEWIGDGTTRAITWPGTVKWLGAGAPGSAPTFVYTVGYENVVVFVARDGVVREKASYSGTASS